MDRLLEIKLMLDGLASQEQEIKIVREALVKEYNSIIEARNAEVEKKSEQAAKKSAKAAEKK